MSDEAPPPQTVHRKVWFQRVGQAKIATDEDPARARRPPEPRLPRLSQLMALVIRYDQLLQTGHIRDFAEISRMSDVSHTRITQIMNLRHLAPDIQEAILFLPTTTAPVDPISERVLRPIVTEPSWDRQRKLWQELIAARL